MVEFIRSGGPNFRLMQLLQKPGLKPMSLFGVDPSAKIQFKNTAEVVSARIASAQDMGRLGIGLVVELPFSVMLVSALMEVKTRIPLVVSLTATTGVLQKGDTVNVSLTYVGEKVEGRIPTLLDIKLADQ